MVATIQLPLPTPRWCTWKTVRLALAKPRKALAFNRRHATWMPPQDPALPPLLSLAFSTTANHCAHNPIFLAKASVAGQDPASSPSTSPLALLTLSRTHPHVGSHVSQIPITRYYHTVGSMSHLL